MMLPFTDRLIVTSTYDAEMSMLADRHYSRRTIGARQFMSNGRKIVLRNTEGTVLFGWMFSEEKLRFDGQRGYCCSIFRNESRRRSSDIILEAEQIAFKRWGRGRCFTYIDPTRVQVIKVRGVPTPGFCFLKAGWKFAGVSKRSGLHLLVKEP